MIQTAPGWASALGNNASLILPLTNSPSSMPCAPFIPWNARRGAAEAAAGLGLFCKQCPLRLRRFAQPGPGLPAIRRPWRHRRPSGCSGLTHDLFPAGSSTDACSAPGPPLAVSCPVRMTATLKAERRGPSGWLRCRHRPHHWPTARPARAMTPVHQWPEARFRGTIGGGGGAERFAWPLNALAGPRAGRSRSRAPPSGQRIEQGTAIQDKRRAPDCGRPALAICLPEVFRSRVAHRPCAGPWRPPRNSRLW